MGGIEPLRFIGVDFMFSPFFSFMLTCLGVRGKNRCLIRCLGVGSGVICGGG